MVERRCYAYAASLAVAVLALTGCTVSEEAKGYTNQAVCATSDATISSLGGAGATARAAATLIRDNADSQRIQNTAQKVIDGDMDENLRQELSDWVTNTCS